MKKFLLILIFIFAISSWPFISHAQDFTKPFKILIAPGHDNEVWGAEYGNIKEADMNLVLATQIYNMLKKDKRFDVYITRDKKGYTKEFADYFSKEKDAIITFKKNAKAETQTKIDNGIFQNVSGEVVHNAVNAETAIELYGINKWANENNIDAVINVHFNDYPRATNWTIGKYKGFVIYKPESQMSNAKESGKLAKRIFIQLSKKYGTSTYEKEKGGLVEDQKLIALGASGTLDKNVNSILIEYGYIYQKIFRDTKTRHQAYKDMASLTVEGINNYFFKR